MKVLKFGGTSVGSPDSMQSVIKIITDGQQKIVVLSAMSGTTNALVEISELLKKKNGEAASKNISELESHYKNVVDNLYLKEENKKAGLEVVEASFDVIKSSGTKKFSKTVENT